MLDDEDELCEDEEVFCEAQYASGRNSTNQFQSTVVHPGAASEASSNSQVPQLYEELIQKLEKDIRQHIAFENQLRIHIENLTSKSEEQDAALAK